MKCCTGGCFLCRRCNSYIAAKYMETHFQMCDFMAELVGELGKEI